MRTKASQAEPTSYRRALFVRSPPLLFTNSLLQNVYPLFFSLTLITLIAFLHKLAYYFCCAPDIFPFKYNYNSIFFFLLVSFFILLSRSVILVRMHFCNALHCCTRALLFFFLFLLLLQFTRATNTMHCLSLVRVCTQLVEQNINFV